MTSVSTTPTAGERQSLLAAALATSHSVLVLQREAEERDAAAKAELARQLAETAEAKQALQRTLAEQKRVEAALREQQRYLDSLVSNLPGMVYRCRPDADWTMLYVSDGCVQLTGYLRRELEQNAGVSFGSLVHPEDRDWLWAKCQASLAAREACNQEYRIIDRAGVVRWVWERASGVYGADGGLELIEGFVTDITDRKRAEAALREAEAQRAQAQKMETLGTLAGGIAHDFNNLLTGMIGCIELSLPCPHAEESIRYLERARGAGLRARDLVKRLMLFSRRAPETVRKRLQLGQLLDETLPILTASLPASITIRTQKPGVIDDVLGDYGQLQQVLMNLCLNAAYAIGSKQGSITVELKSVRVWNWDGLNCPPGAYARLSVEDDGSGMDETTQARVFDPFFTTKPEGEGTGLGLAIVHGIVHDHAGTIRLRSTLGKGTSFEVYLPLCAQESPVVPAKAKSLTGLSGAGLRVLVVDDEEPVRMLVSAVLTMAGFEVETSQNGSDAARCFAAKPAAFAFVILDLSMPGRNGLELIADLRALRPGLPVILMSGDHNRYSSLATDQGCGTFIRLPKPFTIEELKSAIRPVLAAITGQQPSGTV